MPPGRPSPRDAPDALGVVSDGPLRKIPVQGRSIARVRLMVDACAELLQEVSYPELSTTEIAKRAGVAVGSLYQFFPDKRGIVQMLVIDHANTFLRRVAVLLLARAGEPWWEGVAVAVDVYTVMHRNVPGFAALHFGDVADKHLLDDLDDNTAVVAGRLAGLLVERMGAPAGPAVNLAVTVALEAAGALISMAFRRDPLGDAAVLADAKVVVREYLRRRVAD